MQYFCEYKSKYRENIWKQVCLFLYRRLFSIHSEANSHRPLTLSTDFPFQGQLCFQNIGPPCFSYSSGCVSQTVVCVRHGAGFSLSLSLFLRALIWDRCHCFGSLLIAETLCRKVYLLFRSKTSPFNPAMEEYVVFPHTFAKISI